MQKIEFKIQTFFWIDQSLVNVIRVGHSLDNIHVGPWALFEVFVCDSVEIILIQIVDFRDSLLSELSMEIGNELNNFRNCLVWSVGREVYRGGQFRCAFIKTIIKLVGRCAEIGKVCIHELVLIGIIRVVAHG